MMTSEERSARIESLHKTTMLLLDKYDELDKRIMKLGAFNTLFEPPATIRDANEATLKRLSAEKKEAWELYEKVSKGKDLLYALPYVFTLDNDARLTIEGFLPNGQPTSMDEAEAIKMFEDYYATKSA